MVVKMLTKVKRSMCEQRIATKIENIKNSQIEKKIYEYNKCKMKMRHHLIPVRAVIIKKSINNVSESMQKKGNPCTLLVGM